MASLSPQLMSKLVNSEHGFWRDFGFGMACMYSSDFLGVGGFEDYLLMTESSLSGEQQQQQQQEQPAEPQPAFSSSSFAGDNSGHGGTGPSSFYSSWGGEDVLLYRKLLQSTKLNVFRAVDPAIFHLWHEKNCDRMKFQSEAQLRSCLSSKAINEASQLQLAQALAELSAKQNLVF